MKKRFLAGLLTLVMIVSLVPMSALALEGDKDSETPVVCAGYDADATCAANTHVEGCPLYVAPEEQEETVEGPTVAEKLTEMITALPAPEDIDPENEEQVETIYNQISAIYAFAEENDLDVEDNAVINAVIAAAWPTELLDTVNSITANGGTLASGSYTLSSNITLTTNLIIPTGSTVTIDLNGCTLTGNGNGSVITVNGTLTVKDSGTNGKITGGGSSVSDWTQSANQFNGGGIYIDGGSVELQSGAVTGNTAYNGGGVYAASGSFKISGGSISNNSTKRAVNGGGGGVYTHANATFEMTGGTIENNECLTGGGGVFAGGTATMSNGKISNNKAANGGGIACNGTFTMSGGEISGNESTKLTGSNNPSFQGSAVTVKDFIFSGGTINGNKLQYVESDDPSVLGHGAIAIYDNGSIKVSGTVQAYDNLVYESSNDSTGKQQNIYLPSNVPLTVVGNLDSTSKLGVTLQTTSGLAVSLSEYTVGNSICSDESLTVETRDSGIYFVSSVSKEDAVCYTTRNGQTVYYKSLMAAVADLPSDDNKIVLTTNAITLTETVVVPSGKTVTLATENTEGTEITWDAETYSVWFKVPSDSTLNVEGAITLTGNSANISSDGTETKQSSRAFVVEGTLNLGKEDDADSGPVIQNFNEKNDTSDSSPDAAIYVQSGGELNLYSGKLTNNKSENGGAIYAVSATVNLIGGEISDNQVTKSGGAIYATSGSTTAECKITLSGTIIKNNSSTNSGGGIYLNKQTIFLMTGGEISGNKATGESAIGGGIVLVDPQDNQTYTGKLTVQGGKITSNEATEGAGIAGSGGEIVVSGGEISANKATNYGGGISAGSSTLSIVGGDIKITSQDSAAAVFM